MILSSCHLKLNTENSENELAAAVHPLTGVLRRHPHGAHRQKSDGQHGQHERYDVIVRIAAKA